MVSHWGSVEGTQECWCGGTVEEEVGIELCQGWETKWCYPLSKVALTWIMMAEDDEKNVDCAGGDVSACFGIEDCLGWSDVRGKCGEDDLVYTTVVSRFSSLPFFCLRLHAWNTVIHLPKRWLQMEVRSKHLVQREGGEAKNEMVEWALHILELLKHSQIPELKWLHILSLFPPQYYFT